MKIISAIFSSLAVLASVAVYGQDMTMDAKEFNNRKVGSDTRIRSDYRQATGRQFVTIDVENTPAVLSLSYDIEVEKGTTTVLVKFQEEVIWEKEIPGGAQANNEIELPGAGEYLLLIELENASGQHDLQWKLSPSSNRE